MIKKVLLLAIFCNEAQLKLTVERYVVWQILHFLLGIPSIVSYFQLQVSKVLPISLLLSVESMKRAVISLKVQSHKYIDKSGS